MTPTSTSCKFFQNERCALGYHGGEPHAGNCRACIQAGENTPEQASALAARLDRSHPSTAPRISGCCDSARVGLKALNDYAGEFLARRAEMLVRFGHAAHRFARGGFTATLPEILAQRQATCRACDQWDAAAFRDTGRCRQCGCSTWAKLRMATEKCPLGKW